MHASARALGFQAVGITDSSPLPGGARLREWLARGHHAGMRWMDRPGVREDPRAFFPAARSVIVAGWNTYVPAVPPGSGEGRIARFATRPDYHARLRAMLEGLLERLRAVVPCRGVVPVDAQPLLERALGERAGLGWAGGSSCLVAAAHGPWLLLGELLVDVELAPDAPGPPRCGTCARCAASCPTGAIVSPRVVDARRCVAYLTVEHRGFVPRDLRRGVGRWLFGCDACQEACPWTRFARIEAAGRVETLKVPTVLDAAGFLALDEAGFKAAYAGTALMRAGRARMARNAAIVLGNLGDPAAGRVLTAALRDPEPVVRGHAAWALGMLGARAPLAAAARIEADPAVQEELAAAASDASADAADSDRPREG